MTKNIVITKWARNTHGQPNLNTSDAEYRNDWHDYNKSSSVDAKTQPLGNAESFYWVSPGTTHHIMKPWTFTGHDFDLHIPDCAHITKVVFTARMKITGNITVKAPCARFNLYHGTKNVETYREDDTGWEGGYYYHNPNKKLSNTWQDVNYVMSGTEFRKRGYPISELNESRMGIDLQWYNPTKHNNAAHYVSIQYISCTVYYELPDQSIVFNRVTTENSPLITKSGEKFTVLTTYSNKSNAGCCGNVNKTINVNLPPNAKAKALNGNYSNGKWNVQCNPNASASLLLEVVDYGKGENFIEYSLNEDNTNNNSVNSKFWYYTDPVDNDVGEVTPYPDKYMQKGLNSCVTFKTYLNSSDGKSTFNININTADTSNYDVRWSIVENETDSNVSLLSDECTNRKAVFNVPKNTPVNLTFKGCFVPKNTGNTSVTVDLEGKPNPPVEAPYNVLDAPVFRVTNNSKTTEDDRETAEIVLNPSTINFVTHRIASQTELGAYVIECGVEDYDKVMSEEDCSLTADVWQPVDYIGVIPLKYHHYDPESTYSNKAISDTYKNKTYKGKEGVVEENISLKFKIRPWESPTLQGMVKLDKPTPINASHKCFEGDPLNHRGWAVLSEAKIKKTNPLWYDVEAEVDYITHDIYTKFQIFKDLLVNDKPMPDLTAEVISLGENLADSLDLLNIETTGGFIYDEDGEDGAKNIFSLDEGQILDIKTIKPLSDVANVRFDWYSNKINETRENNLERVFKLVDTHGESVFEYEYTNFVFHEDYVSCTVILRVKTADGWKPSTYDIELRTELEADPIVPDEGDEGDYDVDGEETEYYKWNETTKTYEIADEGYEGEVYVYDSETDTYELFDDEEELAYDPQYIAPSFNIDEYDITQIYGSSLIFRLNGNHLTIVDEGYNGREYTSEPIQLLSEDYHFETYWKNNNFDGETGDIISYIDLSLEETILNTDYSKYYKDLYVSPFPIPYKTVVFTRESEEGTIYYLTGDEPFKYLLEPYYQYHCGCDLLGNRTSIFDLNNSYTHYYIENGLVRLGFNKYNGRLYLAKYDNIAEEWITTHYFHLVNEPKFAVETYSDDKIVIKAGNDTFFTIWRGRPYIGIKNPTDVIYIDSKFGYCLSDKINGDTSEYPIIYSFMNTDNLLPAGVGGKLLDSDEFTVDDDEEVITSDYTLELTIPSKIQNLNDTAFTPIISPTPTNGKIHLIVDGVDVTNSEYPSDLVYNFKKSELYKVSAVYVGEGEGDIAFSPIYDVRVNPADPKQEPHPEIEGYYNLNIISAPKKFTYLDKQKVVVQLRKGTTPMGHMPIEISHASGVTQTVYTKSDGTYTIENNNTDYIPGRHQWGARFYDPTDSDTDGRLICEALRWITIEKATPTFTHNDADGKVNKGKSLTVKLNGLAAQKDKSKVGLRNSAVTYSIGKGRKVSTKTDANGKFKVKFNALGTRKLKVMYAGNSRYKAISKTFTIKVVK